MGANALNRVVIDEAAHERGLRPVPDCTTPTCSVVIDEAAHERGLRLDDFAVLEEDDVVIDEAAHERGLRQFVGAFRRPKEKASSMKPRTNAD